MHTLQVEVVKVTPELAAEWLALNNKNRNLRELIAQRYAADMRTGDWRWTGETIKFATDGTLIDGQHRLRAVIIADATLEFLVVRGLEPEAQQDVDRGIPRKFSDVLKMRGEHNYSGLAAVVRRVNEWESGARRSVGNTGTSTTTVASMLRTLEAHPELRDFTAQGKRIGAHVPVSSSLLAMAWWLFSRIDDESAPEDADFFFERLADGQGLVKGDPIYELRRTFDAAKTVSSHRSQTYILVVLIKAWNAYRRGETVGLYRWRPGGANPEQFPEPV